ncbi:hypothetical protein TTHERM_000469289 (macronuclear) [Tetrahymena thermophila SB210]|uniref:Uncharacterized protein n=1 Tax=Tetrahymena thermophila (strain SB210) TaxID=312017 RepID=W7WY20_TETTS|nr:hypothetical protein TTHERM_000469289 [Tetrahymena thermophila SB210]EWS71765.1 hypothetical protein TTHERM_000469289 [Tetrahymena thermophila SB210]|eukprot:XP_012655718.1 hypothetical protein TTHERM_000469289 [Tetrahymena thermophila SB210]
MQYYLQPIPLYILDGRQIYSIQFFQQVLRLKSLPSRQHIKCLQLLIDHIKSFLTSFTRIFFIVLQGRQEFLSCHQIQSKHKQQMVKIRWRKRLLLRRILLKQQTINCDIDTLQKQSGTHVHECIPFQSIERQKRNLFHKVSNKRLELKKISYNKEFAQSSKALHEPKTQKSLSSLSNT